MNCDISVHRIKKTTVKDFHDGKEPEFSAVVITANNGSEIIMHFNDLEDIQDWCAQISLQAELLQEKK